MDQFDPERWSVVEKLDACAVRARDGGD